MLQIASLFASTNPKPFQGLKLQIPSALRAATGFNQPKTLSGIETGMLQPVALQPTGFNQPKTLSGIETEVNDPNVTAIDASTNPKPFQGLKHTTVFRTSTGSTMLQPTQNPFRD